MSQLPIAEYALLSDCRSAALVSKDGSVDWLCFPRFDSPSLFGRLLDARAGHWSIRPIGDAAASRRYVEDTMVLETTFRTATGTVVVVDALAVGRNERGHELGAGAPSVLMRRVTGVTGDVELELEYAPRPEYGLIYPVLNPVDGGVTARGGADVLALSSPVPVEIDELVARARFTVRGGEAIAFALGHATSSQERPGLWSQDEIAGRLDDTKRAWHTWSELHQSYDGPWEELVHHSGRVLYALTYFPTGAICAAPTTSLPETPGGSRNWDYRFSWVRDASFTLQALWVAACPDEADKFFDFMASAAASQVRRGTDLQIMFGIGGERGQTEREPAPPCGWVTVPGASANWMSTASCWTRPRGCPTSSAAWKRRPSSSSPTSPTPPPLAGRSRTRGSGRSGASPATSCTPSSCAGWRSTGRSVSPTNSTPRSASMVGSTRARRSRLRSSPAGGTTRRGRSPHPSGPTTST